MTLDTIDEVLAGPFGGFVNTKSEGPLVVHIGLIHYSGRDVVGLFLHNIRGQCVMWQEADVINIKNVNVFRHFCPETATHPGFVAAVQALKLLQ
jgi:hypothetical protein